jgi:hypothetical protein
LYGLKAIPPEKEKDIVPDIVDCSRAGEILWR